MAKKSRRKERTEAQAAAVQATSPWERYRVWVVGAAIVGIVAIVAYMVISSATASAYTCDELLEAPTDQSGDATSLPGFVVQDEGRSHSNGSLRYATCPPTSGSHRGGGALEQGYYGPGREQVPNDWVHNLEHGYAVIAYAGDPGSEVLGQIRATLDAVEPSEVAEACNLPSKTLALRFDQMSEPFAVLAWDRALLLDSFDQDLVTQAATQFQDLPQAPERAC